MNSYQSLSRESEIPENEQPLNYAEGKRSKTYATETSSPPIRVEPVEEQKSKSLSAMRQHASKQIDQLQKQADLLVKQARQIESRVELAEKIGKARFGFKPVLLQHYFLYRKICLKSRIFCSRLLSIFKNIRHLFNHVRACFEKSFTTRGCPFS